MVILTIPQKVSLAERAETQSVDIYELKYICDILLYLMGLGWFL